MQIYLVQHGAAKAEADDPARPLTDRGRAEVPMVARQAALVGLPLAEILHSGKLRARQTAAILADHLHPSRGLRVLGGMAPNDDPAAARAALDAAHDSVMLVGHLPHLSRLTALLILGDPRREVVRFRNGAIVCLAETEGSWRVHWILSPDIVPAGR